MARIFYFAYGSNLHPLRLSERIPSSQFVNRVWVNRYRLSFNKISEDGSGKCTIHMTGHESDIVHGAVYSMRAEDKAVLDRYEGEGYRDIEIQVENTGRALECFTYIARESHLSEEVLPYDWYRELVVSGAEYHALPGNYIETIRNVRAIPDPQLRRQRVNASLLQKIRKHGV